MMTALINIPFGSLLVNANDGLYDPTRSRQKEDHTSSLTRFTYLDLIGFIGFVVVELDLIYTLDLIGLVVHIKFCLLDFIRFFKLYKI